MHNEAYSLSLSLGRATILIRIKESYLIWLSISPHIPKNARYTLGVRIDNKFLDLLDDAYLAYFSPKANRREKIKACVQNLDTLKFLISIAWEAKFVSHKHYDKIGSKLSEVSKMLSGWSKYTDKNTFARRNASSNSSRPRN